MGSLILALEASGALFSVGLVQDGKPLSHVSEFLKYGQAGAMMPFIEELFSKTSYTIDHVTHVAVNRGPGSFTGIRLSLGAAYGFCAVKKLPILGVTSFQIYWALSDQSQPLLILLDTQRGDFYGCLYRAFQSEPEWTKVITDQEVGDFLKQDLDWIEGRGQIVTDHEEILKQFLPKANLQNLTAIHLADTALKLWFQGSGWSNKPYYLRPAAVYEDK